MPRRSTEGKRDEQQRPIPERAVIVLFLAGLAIYLAVFFTDRARGAALLMALLPDQVLISWIGGGDAPVGLLDRLFVLSFAGMILLLSVAAGWLSLSLLGVHHHLVPLERLVFSAGAGLGQLSLWTLLAGLAGALRPPWILWGLSLLPMAAVAWRWRRETRQPAAEAACSPPTAAAAGGEASRSERGSSCPGPSQTDASRLGDPRPRAAGGTCGPGYGLWLALPFLWLIVLGGMLPPWEFDVREYHLQVPKEWFLAGRVEFLPHNVYGNMPLGAESLALLAMVLVSPWSDWWWGALIGKTLMAVFVPLAALGLYAAGRRTLSPAGGVAAALIYLSAPWVVYEAMAGLNETAVGCYSLLAAYALLLWQQRCESPTQQGTAALAVPVSLSGRSGDGGHANGGEAGSGGLLAVAGFLAGSAAACKYPALLFTVVPLLAWCTWAARAAPWKPAAVFLLSAAAAVGPWYAKNAVFTGNPVYPLVLGGKTRTPERMEQWNRAHRVPRDEQGRRYTPAQAARAIALIAWDSRWTSPLLIPFLALATLPRNRRRLTWPLAALLGWGVLVWWLATHRIDRFLVPLLPWAAWLAASGFTWSQTRSWRRTAVAVLIAGAGFNWFYVIASGQYDPRLLVSLAELRRDEPDEPGGPSRVSAAHRYLNDHVPPNHRALLVGDAQPFDLEVPVWYATCFDPCNFERLMRDRSREQRAAALRRHRISHIYFDWSEIRRYRSPGNYGFTDYVTPARVRELIRQGLLRPVPLPQDRQVGELFEVVGQHS